MRVLLLIIYVAFSPSARAQRATVAEQYLLIAINQERAAHHLAPVALDDALCRAASNHAQEMVRHGDISHQFSGEAELSSRGFEAGAHFSRITENVAEGPSVLGIHDALMRSAGHRANILDAAVDAVGVAVLAWRGQLYAVENFQTTVPTLTLEQQEMTVAMLLDRAGVELVPSAEARQACAMDSGQVENDQPAYIVRYTTDDLAALPSKLKARLTAGHDHRAAVGACVSVRQSAFTEYRIAVLLYP